VPKKRFRHGLARDPQSRGGPPPVEGKAHRAPGEGMELNFFNSEKLRRQNLSEGRGKEGVFSQRKTSLVGSKSYQIKAGGSRTAEG